MKRERVAEKKNTEFDERFLRDELREWEPFTLLIFGASGHLAGRKLIPALFHLFLKGRLPGVFDVVGISRTKMTDEEWRDSIENFISFDDLKNDGEEEYLRKQWEIFSERLIYFPGDGADMEVQKHLENFLTFLENGKTRRRIFYFATAPDLYLPILDALKPGVTRLRDARKETCSEKDGGRFEMEEQDVWAKRMISGGTCRIVVEKPFGRDLDSAKRLNKALRKVFYEEEIFRIDHYLGKETALNLLVLRFANSIFEPIWNRNFVREVQITASEEELVGRRAAYFNRAGILRDMFQNHLLQLLALTAMEPPVQMEGESLRDEKVKVLRSIRPFRSELEVEENTLRGQYLQPPFALDDEFEFLEPSVPTFALLELNVDNWRWRGVPFFLRAGKGMNCRTTQILLKFHKPPCSLFPGMEDIEANMLLIQLQPAEGIRLYFQTKVPDGGMATTQGTMTFAFDNKFQIPLPDAYENLLSDVFRGDTGLFIRDDEVEAAWQIMDPIQKTWDGEFQDVPKPYPAGSWGPLEADRWIEKKGSRWFNFCPILGSCKNARSRNWKEEFDSIRDNEREMKTAAELQTV